MRECPKSMDFFREGVHKEIQNTFTHSNILPLNENTKMTELQERKTNNAFVRFVVINDP